MRCKSGSDVVILKYYFDFWFRLNWLEKIVVWLIATSYMVTSPFSDGLIECHLKIKYLS